MFPYAEIDYSSPVPVPPPRVNGGLYVGAPAQPGAPWGNVAIRPEPADYMAPHFELARGHAPSYTRPGNSEQQNIPYQRMYDELRYTNMKCTFR